MNVRPHIAHDPSLLPRPSARVARVAELLDCDESDIRRLIRCGQLEAHGKGVRGVRVFLDSVRDYQDRRAIDAISGPAAPPKAKSRRTAASTAAYRAAMAGLKAKGIV